MIGQPQRPHAERSLEQCTEPQALAALVAAAHDNPAGDRVHAMVGDIATDWLLPAALRLAREAGEIGWAPDLAAADGYGLVILDDGGGVFRFATRNPTEPAPATRPGLHLVTGRRTATRP